MEKEKSDKVTGIFDKNTMRGAIRIDAGLKKPVAEEIVPQLRKTISQTMGISEEEAAIMANDIFEDIKIEFERREIGKGKSRQIRISNVDLMSEKEEKRLYDVLKELNIEYSVVMAPKNGK